MSARYPAIDAPYLEPSAFRKLAMPVFMAHGIAGFLSLTLYKSIDRDNWFWLGALCAASVLSLSWLVVRSVFAQPKSMMYETGLFLVLSFGAYFAFGASMHAISPLETRVAANAWFSVDASEAVFLTGINFLGLGLAGMSYLLFRARSVALVATRMSRNWSVLTPFSVFWIFVTVGGCTKIFVLWPFQLGMIDSIPVSIVYSLSGLLVVAMFIFARYWQSFDLLSRSFGICLVLLQVALGLIAYNKTDVLLPLIAFSIGAFIAQPQKGRVFVAVLALVLTYMLITPLINYARVESARIITVASQPLTAGDRIETLLTFYDVQGNVRDPSGHSMAWWMRLNYLPSQNAAVYFHRIGMGSDDLERLLWIFVPRFLYSNKPNMTSAGVDLTEKIAGHQSSSTGIGIFVDGYYIMGWLGVLFASVSYGVMLRIYSEIAKPVIESHATVMLPLVFMGIFLGMRTDGWWLTDVVGAAVIAAGILGILWLFRLSRYSFQSQ